MKPPYKTLRALVLGAALTAVAVGAYAKNIIEDIIVSKDEIIVKTMPPIDYKAAASKKTPKFIVEFEDAIYAQGTKAMRSDGTFIKNVKFSQYDSEDNKARLTIELEKPLGKTPYYITEETDGLHIAIGKKTTVAVTTAPTADNTKPKEEFVSTPRDTSLSAKKISLQMKGMPLVLILEAISKQTGASFVVAKSLEQKEFTALMEDVTLRDALRALLEAQGLGYEQVGNSNTFVVKEVSKSKMRLATKIFHLKYTQLTGLQVGKSQANLGASSDSSGSSFNNDSVTLGDDKDDNSGNKQSFLRVVKGMLSDQGKLQIYPETNSLIISDIPENFPSIEELIERLDTPVPQVMIEVYFVETNASLTKNLGIEYGDSDGVLGQYQGASLLTSFPFKLNGSYTPFGNSFDFSSLTGKQTIATTDYFGGISFGILSFQQLTAVLKAIDQTGDGQYLSKPKVLTLNNKPAEIAVTADTVVEFETKQFTGSGYLGTQSKTAKRKTTGITLVVTPQVNEGGQITLAIAPQISRPQLSEFFPTDDVVDTQMRSIKTTVRVKDGSTVLIGGLINNQDSNTIRKVPLLGNLPIIGSLFTSTSKSNIKRELLIFITPKIVKND